MRFSRNTGLSVCGILYKFPSLLQNGMLSCKWQLVLTFTRKATDAEKVINPHEKSKRKVKKEPIVYLESKKRESA